MAGIPAIHPQSLIGNWSTGVALDFHTVSSTPNGVDGQGRPTFDTKRTELGELLYQLKYQERAEVATGIVAAAAGFITKRKVQLDLIVPAPPSKPRTLQPVLVLAGGVGAALGVPMVVCVTKTRLTPELKEIKVPEQRANALAGAFSVDTKVTKGKSVLLFDDLYRSGDTLREIPACCSVLARQAGCAF